MFLILLKQILCITSKVYSSKSSFKDWNKNISKVWGRHQPLVPFQSWMMNESWMIGHKTNKLFYPRFCSYRWSALCEQVLGQSALLRNALACMQSRVVYKPPKRRCRAIIKSIKRQTAQNKSERNYSIISTDSTARAWLIMWTLY